VKDASARIEWLLDFLGRDLAKARWGELFDLRNDVLHILDRDRQRFVADILGGEPEEYPTGEELRGVLADAQGAVLDGLNRLSSDDVWEPFPDGSEPEWRLQRTDDGKHLMRFYVGDIRTIFVAASADLVLEFWRGMRRCEREECDRWFLPRHGKQKYHDPACSVRVRQAKYKSKRDYSREYKDRVTREAKKKVTTGEEDTYYGYAGLLGRPLGSRHRTLRALVGRCLPSIPGE
jgi:hypothetical protein